MLPKQTKVRGDMARMQDSLDLFFYVLRFVSAHPARTTAAKATAPRASSASVPSADAARCSPPPTDEHTGASASTSNRVVIPSTFEAELEAFRMTSTSLPLALPAVKASGEALQAALLRYYSGSTEVHSLSRAFRAWRKRSWAGRRRPTPVARTDAAAVAAATTAGPARAARGSAPSTDRRAVPPPKKSVVTPRARPQALPQTETSPRAAPASPKTPPSRAPPKQTAAKKPSAAAEKAKRLSSSPLKNTSGRAEHSPSLSSSREAPSLTATTSSLDVSVATLRHAGSSDSFAQQNVFLPADSPAPTVGGGGGKAKKTTPPSPLSPVARKTKGGAAAGEPEKRSVKRASGSPRQPTAGAQSAAPTASAGGGSTAPAAQFPPSPSSASSASSSSSDVEYNVDADGADDSSASSFVAAGDDARDASGPDAHAHGPGAEDPLTSVRNLKSMQEVIPGLWCGSYVPAMSKECLQSHGITHVCCCVDVGRFAFPDDFLYMKVPVMDSYDADIIRYFPQTFEFIENALIKQHGAVLVHCGAGISRAPTVTAAYLIKKLRVTPAAAVTLVQQRRPFASPNPNFRQQLRTYAQRLKVAQADTVREAEMQRVAHQAAMKALNGADSLSDGEATDQKVKAAAASVKGQTPANPPAAAPAAARKAT